MIAKVRKAAGHPRQRQSRRRPGAGVGPNRHHASLRELARGILRALHAPDRLRHARGVRRIGQIRPRTQQRQVHMPQPRTIQPQHDHGKAQRIGQTRQYALGRALHTQPFGAGQQRPRAVQRPHGQQIERRQRRIGQVQRMPKGRIRRKAKAKPGSQCAGQNARQRGGRLFPRRKALIAGRVGHAAKGREFNHAAIHAAQRHNRHMRRLVPRQRGDGRQHSMAGGQQKARTQPYRARRMHKQLEAHHSGMGFSSPSGLMERPSRRSSNTRGFPSMVVAITSPA